MDLNGIRWATSFGDIERAVVYPGTAALFMYTEEDAFAIKTVDSRGYATISEYDFTRRKPRAPKGFVSQEDYDKLRKELKNQSKTLYDQKTRAMTDRGEDIRYVTEVHEWMCEMACKQACELEHEIDALR